MLSNKIKIIEVDKYIYMKNTNISYINVCLSMDDILILDNNDHMIRSTNKILTNKFNMKNLGVVDFIL